MHLGGECPFVDVHGESPASPNILKAIDLFFIEGFLFITDLRQSWSNSEYITATDFFVASFNGEWWNIRHARNATT